MPSTGTPSANTASGARGGCAAMTDSGPPERMTPRGAKARTASSAISQGWISQYTPLSRTRRAISWVYCAPKSRIRIRCAWMSAAVCVVIFERLGNAVVRRFFGNGHIVYMALADPGVGDPHELRLRAHDLDGGAAGVAHRGTQSAGQLVQDG